MTPMGAGRPVIDAVEDAVAALAPDLPKSRRFSIQIRQRQQAICSWHRFVTFLLAIVLCI